VKFHGAVYDQSQLIDYYHRASVFIYPSIAEKGEAFPLAPLESMAWGCVPVVSSLECFNDYIYHGTNGMRFDAFANNAQNQFSSTVLELIANSELREQLAMAALEVRDSYATNQIAQAFLKDFRAILDERTAASKR